MQPYAQVLEEYTPGGAVLVSYVYGNDLISQIRYSSSQPQTGTTTYYHVDGLGSTTELTDSQGAIVSTSRYDAFGRTIAGTGTVDNKYLFAGEQYDPNLGDYYLRQRYYNSNNGRFTRRDSYEGKLREPVTLHKYIYGNGNPIMYVDPSGYISENDMGTGDFLHNTIGAHFLAAGGIFDLTNPMNPDREIFSFSRVYEPRFPLGFIANKPTFLRVVRTATNMPQHPGIPLYNGSSPDLTDFSSKELYEIKPADNPRAINEARQKLEGAIEAMRWIGYGMTMMGYHQGQELSGWHKGETYIPPLAIPLNSGRFAVVKLLEPGMVVYKIHNPGRILAAAVTAVAIQELIVEVQIASIRNSRTPAAGLI